MNSRPNLRVRISADLADIRQGLGLLRGDLASLKKSAAAAMPNLGSNAAVAGVRRLRTEVAGLVGTFLSLRGAGLLSGVADEASLIRGRVRAAKGDYEALLALAQDTRTGLAGTIDLYARMERSTRNQNINQERLLKLTRAVNQAVKLSYADQGAADAAIMQLGQGLASGTLRGDELNSVIEQTPRLAEAIANGMGKSIGQLRELGKQGKLTGEMVIKALEDQAGVLEREYAQVPLTIKDAFTQIRNSFVDYVGDVDASTGASRRFAETLQQIARDLPKYLDPVLKVVQLLLANLDALAVFMVVRMAGAAIPAMVLAYGRLVKWMRAAAVGAASLRTGLMLLGGPVGIAIGALAAALYLVYKRTNDARRAAEEHNKALDENRALARQSAQAAMEDAVAKRKQAAETLKAAQAALLDAQVRMRASYSTTARGGDRGDAEALSAARASTEAQAAVDAAQQRFDDIGKRLVELALQINDEVLAGTGEVATATVDETGKAIAGSNALIRDAIARALRDLDQMYADHDIGINEYFRGRVELQQKAVDAEIAQVRMQLAVTKELDQRRKLEEDLVKLQRDRAEIGVAAAREEKKAVEDLDKVVEQNYIARMEREGRLARAARARLEEEQRETIIRLQAEGREDDVRLIRLEIDAGVAKAQLSQFEEEMSQTLARLQSTEQSLSAQQQAGLLGVIESERQVKDIRSQSLQQLVDLRQRAVEFLGTLASDSPEAAKVLDFLRQLDGEVATVASSMDRFRQQIADAAIDSLTNFFTDLVEGSKSAGEALRDFVRGFAMSMAQIASRALATFLVLKMLDAVYPGLGKATAATMSVGQNHSGGIAGAPGGIRRNVSPLLFGQAPRYHKGGIAGLEPGEVPAILERGERIRTEEQEAALQRQLAAGSGEAGRVTTPVVVFGEQELANALAGRWGEQMVITHVRNNRRAIDD